MAYKVIHAEQFIGTDYPWAVIDTDDGAIMDRYDSEAEANEALPGYYEQTVSSGDYETYEVTVPVIVQVTVSTSPIVPSGALTIDSVMVDPGYGGMHGEAENHYGIFHAATDSWGAHDDAPFEEDVIADLARARVQHILEGFGQPSDEPEPEMQAYRYAVIVAAPSLEEARQVMSERLDPDEDYGFEYAVDWTEDDWTDES